MGGEQSKERKKGKHGGARCSEREGASEEERSRSRSRSGAMGRARQALTGVQVPI